MDTLELHDPVMRTHIELNTDLIQQYREQVGSDQTVVEILNSDEFADFANDRIKCEAECVDSFERVVEHYGEEESFSHNVMEYQGIFFYQSVDYDDVGYWLNRRDACDYAEGQSCL